MIGKTLGKYRIISELGKGGMGITYLADLAEHTAGIGGKFAIKNLSTWGHDSHSRERFYREAKNQALLKHPNIVSIFDFFEKDGQFFLVMEYVEGQTLRELIKARGQLKEEDALAILRDVLRGLEFAHSKSMIHGDIQPSNILIDKSGITRIMNFGEGRLTSRYMSPEQFQRPRQLDRRTDIYSLGIVVYEMLAGDVPFSGLTDYSVLNQQIHSPPPNLHRRNPEISEEVAEIVLKAMAKNPAERFQDCTEFLQCLREQERQPSEGEVKRKAEEETRKRIEEERNRAGKFFFSYARADSEFVMKLAEELRSIGTNLWLDQLDIPGGARWDDAVEEALHASPCLLVVLSPASVASNNVKDEISFGIENGKTIMPILYKNCDIPFRLKRLQYIDFTVDYDSGFKRLVQTLKLVDQLPARPSVKSIPETRGPSEKEETKQVSGLNAHELTAIREASQVDRSETKQTCAAKLTLTPLIGGVDENHWIRLLHRRMPLLLWLSLLPYVGFVWLLLGSNEKDRTVGFLFGLNVVIVLLGSIGSYFGKIPTSKVCSLGALVQIGVLIAMLSRKLGDTGIVIAINLAIAAAFGGMAIFYYKQERKQLLPNTTVEEAASTSPRRPSP